MVHLRYGSQKLLVTRTYNAYPGTMTTTAEPSVAEGAHPGAADLQVEPEVIEIRDAFLAVTPGRRWPRIGITGATRAEARERFQEAWTRWQYLLAVARRHQEGP